PLAKRQACSRSFSFLKRRGRRDRGEMRISASSALSAFQFFCDPDSIHVSQFSSSCPLWLNSVDPEQIHPQRAQRERGRKKRRGFAPERFVQLYSIRIKPAERAAASGSS